MSRTIWIPNNKPYSSSFRLTHFLILISHTSIHCWKDSSGTPLSSVVMALLMTFTLSKWISFVIPLSLWKRKSHKEKDLVNREVLHIYYFSQWKIARCTDRWEQMHYCSEATAICTVTTLLFSFLRRRAVHRLHQHFLLRRCLRQLTINLDFALSSNEYSCWLEGWNRKAKFF